GRSGTARRPWRAIAAGPRRSERGRRASAGLCRLCGAVARSGAPRRAGRRNIMRKEPSMAANDTQALRREMVDICRRMNASGINQGTAGNLSVRAGDGFLITPSSLPYESMTPEDIVEMDFDGTYVGRRPSSEWRFHRDILRVRTDIDVVLHCHSVYATTLACHHKRIPAFHYMVGVA